MPAPASNRSSDHEAEPGRLAMAPSPGTPAKVELRRRRRSQTTVEFALILWPFLMLLFATLDYAQLYFFESSIRHAVRAAGRFATPGSVFYSNQDLRIPKDSLYSAGNPMSRNESIRYTFMSNCVITAIQEEDIEIESWPDPSVVTGSSYTESSPQVGPGEGEWFVRIRVTYPLQLITPVAALLWEDGIYDLTVQSIFRNEPSRNFNDFTNRYSSEPQ